MRLQHPDAIGRPPRPVDPHGKRLGARHRLEVVVGRKKRLRLGSALHRKQVLHAQPRLGVHEVADFLDQLCREPDVVVDPQGIGQRHVLLGRRFHLREPLVSRNHVLHLVGVDGRTGLQRTVRDDLARTRLAAFGIAAFAHDQAEKLRVEQVEQLLGGRESSGLQTLGRDHSLAETNQSVLVRAGGAPNGDRHLGYFRVFVLIVRVRPAAAAVALPRRLPSFSLSSVAPLR
mmetsp:Transcript_4918/g.12263  ORF Transcript_4918/g.12263 Transcript_4918/m.12263 type:complete len:231 (+) Transcript_4918:4865-5557(+)